MKKCIGTIGIVNKAPRTNNAALNTLIGEFREIVAGRLGVPKHEPEIGVISLVVEGSAERIYDLEKQLKAIDGLAVSMTLSDY